MKTILFIAGLYLALVLAEPAFAAGCTTQSYMLPNGKFTVCTTCCDDTGYCHTTCT